MTTSMVVRTLESKGYVVRAGNTEDTRVKNISLTASGKKVALKAVKKVELCDQAFFAVLGKEMRTFNALLTKLAR
jgi:DNA-binding MarR family transcriptional regulator